MIIECKKIFVFCKQRLLKLIMRTFVFLFMTSVFGLGPKVGLAQNANIIIDEDRTVSLEQVFELISQQTGYEFVYNSELINDAPLMELKEGIVKAGTLLQKGLSPIFCTFEFTGNTVIVKQKMHPTLGVPLQETFTVQGIVTDKNGVPIPGATVFISSTEPIAGVNPSTDYIVRGTSADFDGKFTIVATLNHFLAVSTLGYGFYYEQISSKQEYYTITLLEEANILDEVLVVGYGSTVKKDLTGTVGSVKAKEIKQIRTQTIDQALVGQISGVFVSGNGGAPGSGATVNIRGLSQIRGDNQPLYVIDGVPIVVNPNFDGLGLGVLGNRENPLLSINPDDVERIDVLKDASAAAIYGSRAANGVIIVTTKKGRRFQEPKLSFSINSTIQNPINELNFLNASQYRAFASEQAQIAIDNFAGPAGLIPIILPNESAIVNDPDSFFRSADTDWQDLLTNNNALWSNYNLSYTGGSESTNYLISATVNDQEGVLLGNKFQRYSFSGNVETNTSKKFKVGSSILYNYAVNKTSGISGLGRGNFRPDLGLLNEDGSFTSSNIFFGRINVLNPVEGYGKDMNKAVSQNFLGSIFGEYEIVDGLKLRSQFSAGITYDRSSNFSPSFSSTTRLNNFFQGIPDRAELVRQNNSGYTTAWESTLNYNKVFSDKHNINAVVGVSYNKNRLDLDEQAFASFPDNSDLINSGNATNVFRFRSDATQSVLNSIFGRINYGFDDRYLLTFTARQDGSTKFGPGNRYGFFPSGAIAWNVHNEKFLKDSKFISQLKLRASLGRTGSDNLPDFTYRALYGTLDNNDSFYNGQNGIVVDGVVNENIRWEETDQLDIGLEFGLFNNRVNAEAVYFEKNTSGIILLTPAPSQTGELRFNSNIADVSNSGFEFTLSGDILRTDNFRWNSSFNITFVDNNVNSLNGSQVNSFGSRGIREGSPIGTNFVFDVIGIAQTQEEIDALNAGSPDGTYHFALRQPGDYIYKDVNGDGQITNAEDQIGVGDINPDYFAGWNNTVTYKNLDFSFNLQMVEGVERYWSRIDGLFGIDGFATNYTDLVNDTWTPNNTDARYARFGSFSHSQSSRSVFDASYIRLRSASIGYSFPESVMKKLGVSAARLSVSGNNIFTITDYPGIDPESVGPQRGGSSVDLLNDEDSLAYPQTRTFTIGLNVSF